MPGPGKTQPPVDPFDSLFGDLPTVEGVDTDVEITSLDSGSAEEAMQELEDVFSMSVEEDPEAFEDMPTVAFDSASLGEAPEDWGEAAAAFVEAVSAREETVVVEEDERPVQVVIPMAEPEPEPEPVAQAPEPEPETSFEPVADDLIAQTLAKVRKRKQLLESGGEPAEPPMAERHTEEPEAPPRLASEEDEITAGPSFAANEGAFEDTMFSSAVMEGDDFSVPTFSGPSNFDLQVKTPEDPFTHPPVLSSFDMDIEAGDMEAQLERAAESDEEEEDQEDAYYFTMGFEAEEAPQDVLVQVEEVEEEEEDEEPVGITGVISTNSPDELEELDADFARLRALAREGIRSLGLELLKVMPEESEEDLPEFEEEDLSLLAVSISTEDHHDQDHHDYEEAPASEAEVAITRVNAIGGPAQHQEAPPPVPVAAPAAHYPTPPEDLPEVVDTLEISLAWDVLDKLETAARHIMRHRSPRLRQRISAETLVHLAVQVLAHMDLHQAGVRSPEDLLDRLIAQIQEAPKQP